MSDCDTYSTLCRREFAEIHRKLDHLDVAIRGNGKPGIQLRLDRLEQIEAGRKRLTWIVIGAAVSALAAVGMDVAQLVGRL